MHDAITNTGRFTGNRRRASGRVLPDLVAGLLVAGILGGLAAPSVHDSWQARRSAAQARDFVADLAYAQEQAARRGQRVGVCAGAGADCGLRNHWGHARTVWVDIDGNGRLDPGEPVLRVRPQGSTDPSLFSTAGTASVAFGPDGRLQGLPGTVHTWALRAPGQEAVQCIRVNNAGRALLATGHATCA